jgi:HlyD family secretion protein
MAQIDANRSQERAAESNVRSGLAAERVAQAQLDAARANLRQKEAALAQAQIDLDRTLIRAPVDGVVVSRNVDVGQTVAASLQAPVLFTIAQDLSQMEVDTSVDEADVGRLRLGQRAAFTVDSFPTQTFSGEVNQIRKAPQIVQNVVTYTVVIHVGNPEQKLLPGMTANVRIIIDSKPSALKVPNAALRFRPPGVEAEGAGGARPGPPRAERGVPSAGRQGARGDGGAKGRVWVLGPDSKPRSLDLTLGVTDGTSTEILAGDLTEGMEILIGLRGGPMPSAPGGATPRLRL